MSGRGAKSLGTTPKPAFAKTMVLCRNGNSCRRNRCKFVHAKDPEYPECLRRQGSKVVKPSPLRAAAPAFTPVAAVLGQKAPVVATASASATAASPAPALGTRPVEPNANRRAREHNESKWAEEDEPASVRRAREHNESKWAEEDMPAAVQRAREHNESKWAEEDMPVIRRPSAAESKEAEADAENAAFFTLSPRTSRRSLTYSSKNNNNDGESKLDESYSVTPLPNERTTRKGGKKRVRKTRKGARKH
jgi:hypothetical protein